MGRLIDADALYAKVQEDEELARKRVLDTESTLPFPTNLNPAYTRYLAQMDERTKLKHMIADAPTIYPEPPKMGKWVQDESFVWVWHCSECGKRTTETIMGKPMYKFCPMCGARMKGAGDGDD